MFISFSQRPSYVLFRRLLQHVFYCIGRFFHKINLFIADQAAVFSYFQFCNDKVFILSVIT